MNITVPYGRGFYQTINFGTINYTYPSSLSTTEIDEILISDSNLADGNQLAFIKRYNTWVLYSYIANEPITGEYNIVLIYLDNEDQIAYTASDVINITISA